MNLPFFEAFKKKIGSVRGNTGVQFSPWGIFGVFVAAIFVFAIFAPGTVVRAFDLTLFLSPLWLPAILLPIAWHMWLAAIRGNFIVSQEYAVYEIRLPRELAKTPLAMEAVFSGLHLGPGESNWWKKYVLGAVRPWWSLEMVSTEGRVHFYIWSRKGFRRLIEAQLYAQYPGIEIVEAPDYTRLISGKDDEWHMWGCDFEKSNDTQAIPIKTYVDYGLDKPTKEHEQVDPIANVIEFLGSMGRGEHLWIQIMFRVTKSEKYPGKKTSKGKPWTWKAEGEELVEEMRKEAQAPYIDPLTGKEMRGFPNPTKGKSELMASIERNFGKLGFDVGMRGVYLARPDNFNGITITGLIGIWKQFSSETYNGFKPARGLIPFDDYPWELFAEARKAHVRKKFLDAYRRRAYFHAPPQSSFNIMSTEELATIFHIPSASVQTPTLPRIESATSEGPPNLPT